MIALWHEFLPALAGVYLRGREDSVAQSAQLLRQDFGAHRNVVGAAAQLNVAQQIVFLRNDFVERLLPDGRVANAGKRPRAQRTTDDRARARTAAGTGGCTPSIG